jgi:hypothetical protein
MPDSNRHEPNHHNIPQEKDLGESGGPPKKAGGATSGAILPQEGPKEPSGRLSVHQLAQALAGLSDDDRRRLLKLIGDSEGVPPNSAPPTDKGGGG